MERPLTPEEISKAQAKGITVTANTRIDDSTREIFEIDSQQSPNPPSTQLPTTAAANTMETSSPGGTIARSVAESVAPLVTGRIAQAAIGAKTAAMFPGTPLTKGIAGVVGGTLGGLGVAIPTSILQNKAIQALAGDDLAARIARQREVDREKHPILSAAAPLLLSPLAGGGVGVAGNAKQIATTAGLVGTVDAAQQLATTGRIDPAQTAAMTVGGTLTSRPIGAVRALERQALSRFPNFRDMIAPPVTPTTAVDSSHLTQNAIPHGVNPEALQTAATQVHKRPTFSMEFALNAPLDSLKGLDEPFWQVVHALRKEQLPITPDDVTKISEMTPGMGAKRVLGLFREQKRQELFNLQQLAAKNATVQPTQPGATAKPTPVDGGSAAAQAENPPIPAAATPAEGGTQNTGPVVQPAGQPAVTPVPESPATIAEQLKLMRRGARGGVLITPGEAVPELKPNEVATPTSKGTVIHRKLYDPNEVKGLFERGEEGEFLGYGVAAKPPPSEPAVAVTVQKGPTEVQSVLTTKATAEPVVEAAEVAAKESGGDIVVQPPEAVLRARLAELEQKLAENKGQTELSKLAAEGPKTPVATPEETSNFAKGIKIQFGDDPRNIKTIKTINQSRRTIGWEKNQGMAMSFDALGNMIREGKARIVRDVPEVAPKPAETPAPAPVAPKVEAPPPAKVAPSNPATPYVENKGLPIGTTTTHAGKQWTKTPQGWKGEHGVTVSEKDFKSLWQTIENSAKPKGIGGGINKAIEKNKEGGFVINPFDAIRPTAKRIVEFAGEKGKKFVKHLEDTFVSRDQMMNPVLVHLNELANQGFSASELKALDQHFIELKRSGTSSVTLTPELQKLADDLNAVVLDTAADKSRPDSPWVLDYNPATGTSTARPFKIRPHYFPEVADPRVLKLIQDPAKNQSAEWHQLKKDYIDFQKSHGMTDEEALKSFVNRQNPAYGESAPNSEFRGMRFEEGNGLPDSWRIKNPIDAMKAYIVKHATDMAFHRNIESNPEAATLIGLKDNGRGKAYPVVTPTGTEPDLAGNDNVRAAIADYLGLDPKGTRELNRLTHLFTTPLLGPLTQAKDILSIPGVLSEVATIGEQRLLIGSAFRAFTQTAKDAAIKGGSVKAGRNVVYATAQDLTDTASKLVDGWSAATGAEGLARTARTMVHDFGYQLAKLRLASGKADELFDQFGPADWKSKMSTPAEQESTLQTTAAKITNHVLGSYNFKDLPPALLRGGGHDFLRAVFALQRWSVGRLNNWRAGAIEPAKKGNLRPLLGGLTGGLLSAGAINWLNEQIANRKPRELTWEEWLNLGKEDTIYTLFSKVNTAGYAGIASQLAFSVVQGLHGEMPRGFNNLFLQAGHDIGQRAVQFLSALSSGEADLGDTWTILHEILKDRAQVVRLLSDQPETGNREEKIARRLGYLPKQSRFPSLPNPFSEGQRYQRGDAEGLARMFENDLEQGRRPRAPGVDVRQSRAIKDGNVTDYYGFIERAQGKAASDAAYERDVESTRRKREIYSTARRMVQ